jgi:hypothetical protein
LVFTLVATMAGPAYGNPLGDPDISGLPKTGGLLEVADSTESIESADEATPEVPALPEPDADASGQDPADLVPPESEEQEDPTGPAQSGAESAEGPVDDSALATEGYPADDPVAPAVEEGTALELSPNAAVDVQGTYLIQPLSSADKVIDIHGASKTDKANAAQYRSHLGANQRFTFTLNKDNTYTITCVNSQKVLDVQGAQKANRANVIQYHPTGGANQKWVLEKNKDGSYTIASALDTRFVLDIYGGSNANSANLIIYQKKGNAANQSFKLIPTTSTPPAAGDVDLAVGIYTIQDNLSPVRSLDIEGASLSSGARVILWDKHSRQNQRFYLSRDSSGLYAIRPLHAGTALGTTVPAREVVQLTYVSEASSDISYLSQRWIIRTAATGLVRFENAATGLCLDIAGANPTAGTALIVYGKQDKKSQSFSLAAASPVLPKAGIYTLTPKAATSKRLDIQGNSVAEKASVIVWASNGGQNQKFLLIDLKDGSYALSSLISGKYLTEVSGKLYQMTATSSDLSQKWEIKEMRGGFLLKNQASGRCLAADSNAVTTQMVALSSDPFVVPAKCLFSFAGAAAINKGYYFISLDAVPSRVLDVRGSSRAAGADVLLWSKHGAANQIWLVSQNSDGSYWISSAPTSLRLDVSGANAKDGAKVIQYTAHSNANQKWRIIPADNGSFYLQSALGSNLTLSGAGGSTANGSTVVIADTNKTTPQKFRFTATKFSGYSGNADLDGKIQWIINNRTGTSGDVLWKSFDYVSHSYRYISGSTYPQGDWSVPFAIEMVDRGGGNCYRFAALFCWLARAYGYDARVVSGAVPSFSGGWAPHAWVEIYKDGQVYVCDPDMENAYPSYDWYMKTYAQAPINYRK